jgi:DNA-binding transcriptional regulator GbsR (MarR family)
VAKKKETGIVQAGKTQGQMNLPILDLSFLQLYSNEIRSEKLIAKLNPFTFCIWVLMRASAATGGKDSGKIFLSLSQMKEATGFSINTIRSSIEKLVAEGMIRVMTDGKQKRKYYVIDTFRDINTKQEIVKVEYKPDQQAIVRSQLREWTQGKSNFPKMDGITLIQQNAQTIVNIYVKDAEQAAEVAQIATDKLKSGDGKPWSKYLNATVETDGTTVNVAVADKAKISSED